MTVEQGQSASRLRKGRLPLDSSVFYAATMAFDAGVILSTSLASGLLYHQVVYGRNGVLSDYVAVGCAAGALYVLPFILRGQCGLETFVTGKRGARAVFNSWSYAFLCLAILGFMTKTIDFVSRGWIALFYVSGLIAVLGMDVLLHSLARWAMRTGLLAPRRVLVLGRLSEILNVRRALGTGERGASATAAFPLPEDVLNADLPEADLRAALAPIVTLARGHSVSEIVIALPLHETRLAARIADELMQLPVAIHIGQLDSLASFSGLRVERLGALTTLAIVAPPLSRLNGLVKRAFDVVVASAALVLLSPLLLVVAAAIRLDSPGPILFRQRRRGFNHEVFEIWKFRTMTTQDNGDVIVQAERGDDRITGVGHLLRRTNIDELPQLVQVVTGKMSLVGPRPHAVAHDKQYERVISQYARRLNVKPGITGWAQINGCRGTTKREVDMQRRVDHDIYYIDNWSFPLDLYILAMTVLSPKAYRNAY